MDNCNNCRFAVNDGGLTCRRRAPKPYHYPMDKFVSKGANWPIVSPSDWCGEHELIRITKEQP